MSCGPSASPMAVASSNEFTWEPGPWKFPLPHIEFLKDPIAEELAPPMLLCFTRKISCSIENQFAYPSLFCI
ncbi:hypothetical protein D5086_025449 [Populus alba]|uniref:Uncharacterized protein n=1 Tax=Populus alba TaxID=43335 RepID=A0ACC4AZG7_POPAL